MTLLGGIGVYAVRGLLHDEKPAFHPPILNIDVISCHWTEIIFIVVIGVDNRQQHRTRQCQWEGKRTDREMSRKPGSSGQEVRKGSRENRDVTNHGTYDYSRTGQEEDHIQYTLQQISSLVIKIIDDCSP